MTHKDGKVTYLKLTTESYGGRNDADKPYGSWSGWSEEHPKFVEIVKEKEYWDQVVNFPVKKGGVVYIVAVTYSTGDSFGTSDGHKEYVGIYENGEDADFVARFIDKKDLDGWDKKDHCDIYNYKLDLPSGDKEEINCGAFLGYFESISHTDVHVLRVK